jgi:SAM-dependent methyltransferase
MLKTGRQLQIVTSDGSRPLTRNVTAGPAMEAAVDELLAHPFGNWHVESVGQAVQVRVTKRGEALVHVSTVDAGPVPAGHDQIAQHVLAPDDSLFDVIGGNAAKRRQVDAFLRALATTLKAGGFAGIGSPASGPSGPRFESLRVVDLGCGNAYLTFAAYRYLAGLDLDVRMVGVDLRADQRERNTNVTARLGWSDRVEFVAGTIAEAPVEDADLVLALHACDTATDEALARAIGWRAKWILAAPCCHHDVAAQLRHAALPASQALLTRHGILRERFADVLTDSLRAALLKLHGYRVDVVEFIDSAHTPRNSLLRATYTGVAATPAQQAEYAELTATWQVRPYLEKLLTVDI